jgi:ADP-ribose pyrophosphatase YjhB (NUDIX family)
MRKAVRAIIIRGDDMLVMKRNKFGHEYYALVGGGIDHGETAEQSLYRELAEETGLKIGTARLVFIEEAGDPYGTQYIYLCEYVGGEPALRPDSIEAQIHADGKNLYEPGWLPLKDLPASNFLSERLKKAIMKALGDGFPEKPVDITHEF